MPITSPVLSGQVEWRSAAEIYWTALRPSARVLVVDDDPSLRSLLRILLTSSGFEVSTANNGQEALDSAEAGSFDIILLDLEMPVMNGRDFFREFRRRGNETPVVVISAYGAESGQRELGAQGAISKPFDPGDLPRILEQILEG